MPVKFDLGSKLGKICGGKIQKKSNFAFEFSASGFCAYDVCCLVY